MPHFPRFLVNKLTCMFHVRGRCADTVVVTAEAIAVVATDC